MSIFAMTERNRQLSRLLRNTRFSAAGSRNDLSTYTHLIWCTAGKAKSIDVNWFARAEQFPWFEKPAGARFL